MSHDDLDIRLDALRRRPPLTAHGRETALRRAAFASGRAPAVGPTPLHDGGPVGADGDSPDDEAEDSAPWAPTRGAAPWPAADEPQSHGGWPDRGAARVPRRRSVRPRTAEGRPRAGAPAWARWRLSWRAAGAGALALALLAGAVVLRATAATPGPPVELPRPSPPAAAAAIPGAGAPSGGSVPSAGPGGAPARLVVHVAGAVRHPGVVRLEPGARMVDAIEAAGGARGGADLTALNLARPVVDGEQVLVLREGEAPPPSSAGGGATGTAGGTAGSGDGAAVDLNTADAAALDALPGIGPVLAQRIVDQRASHPFASVDELVEVPGIGPALLERLRPLVRV